MQGRMFKKTILLGLLCCIFALNTSAIAGNHALPSDIQKQLNLPEQQLDIGIAALTFARAVYPYLDVPAYSARVDHMAAQVRQLVGDSQDPERRIRALNTVIYLREGIRYDHAADARSRQEYYFLNGILDTKRGICFTMPLLYMTVAHRLGYPIYPVAAPDHLFLRYVDPTRGPQNIEATSGGKYIPDAQYIRNFAVSRRGLESGSYLKTLSKREFLGHLLGANAVIQAGQDMTPAALAFMEKAAELNPKHADHYDRLYVAYLEMSQKSQGQQAEKYRRKAGQSALKARELGYVHPDEITRAREAMKR